MKKLYFQLLVCVAQLTYAQKTYIQGGKLIDGFAGTAQTAMTIVVEGNSIVDIEKGYTSGGAADKTIDLKNKTVMPGLIDCHVHLESQGSKTSMLEGFTMTDADISYKLSGLSSFGKGRAKVSFKIGNLFNRQGNFASLNSDVNSNPLYFVIPSRNYQLSLAVPF